MMMWAFSSSSIERTTDSFHFEYPCALREFRPKQVTLIENSKQMIRCFL